MPPLGAHFPSPHCHKCFTKQNIYEKWTAKTHSVNDSLASATSTARIEHPGIAINLEAKYSLRSFNLYRVRDPKFAFYNRYGGATKKREQRRINLLQFAIINDTLTKSGQIVAEPSPSGIVRGEIYFASFRRSCNFWCGFRQMLSRAFKGVAITARRPVCSNKLCIRSGECNQMRAPQWL